MSMILCAQCHDMADSDDYPEGFVLRDGKDVFICARCQLNNEQQEGEPAPEDRDDA